MMIRSSLLSSCFSGLSDELLIEILCRLDSCKSATRCKCICKRWFTIINGAYSRYSYFLRRWRQFHPEEDQLSALVTQFELISTSFVNGSGDENPHVIDYFPKSNKELPTFDSLEFLPCYTGDIENPICVLATFKDLFLCCPNRKNHSVYYICNPFTKQWTVLPLPLPLPSGCPSFNILADLVVPDDNDGYGNDLKFKVVRVLEPFSVIRKGNESMLYVEIFSSDDSSCTWKRKETSVHQYPYSHGLISYRGMLVWRVFPPEGEEFIGFTFNIDDDHVIANYIRLPSPPPYIENGVRSGVGVCKGRLRKGHLRIIYTCSDNISRIYHKLSIWELDSHRKVWDLVHELDLFEFESKKDYFSVLTNCWFCCVLAFHPRDKDILYLSYHSNISVTCLCNIGKRTIEIIREFPSSWKLPGNVFPLQTPSWLTPVPLLRCPPELQKQS